jgi:4-aminobutyrate--pyruvate transaminase
VAARPNSLAARDAAVLLHPYTNAIENEAEGAFVVTRGEGVYVYDEDGRKYLDAMAGLWCASLGFSNERLAQAASDQIRKLAFYQSFFRRSHPAQIELAERLLAIAPKPMTRVFFANSGSEAADSAIKIAWFYNIARGKPDKRKIVGRRRGYHGVTAAAASLSGMAHNHDGFGLPLPGFLHTDTPHYARLAEPGESEEAYSSRLAANLDSLIRAEGPDTVAAFFAEPVMGVGGVLLPPKTYFAKIERVLRAHDVLFVADEVITGFGRTGSMWACETFGLTPDLVTCAKALSAAAAPIAAVMMSEKVYRTVADKTGELGTFGHGFTYSGHPVSAAVALETLKIYEEMDLVGRVREIGPYLQAKLAAFRGQEMVGEVAGVGMLGVIELVRDSKTGAPFDPALKVGPHLAERALAHGLVVRAMGDRIGFAPPLIIGRAELDELFDKFAAALEDTRAWAKSRAGTAPA